MNAPESSACGKAQSAAKEKKTRRRLRLSCVECTKRRQVSKVYFDPLSEFEKSNLHPILLFLLTLLSPQKCDRNQPCSLCVSRGVEHLCRWENVPVARPTPVRPPAAAIRESSIGSSAQDQEAIIQELRQRVSILERELRQERPPTSISSLTSPSTLVGATPSMTSPPVDFMSEGSMASGPSFRSPSGLYPMVEASSQRPSFASALAPIRDIPEPMDEDEPEEMSFPIMGDQDFEWSSTLAQLNYGHHGEYVGRGTLICSLHSVSIYVFRSSH